MVARPAWARSSAQVLTQQVLARSLLAVARHQPLVASLQQAVRVEWVALASETRSQYSLRIPLGYLLNLSDVMVGDNAGG